MGTDYGQYHDDIWDLIEFTQGTADVRCKYLADTELEIVLKSAIDSLDKAKSLLIEKAKLNVIPTLSQEGQ